MVVNDIRLVLHEARPSWTGKELGNAEVKLKSVGIETIEQFVAELEGDINVKLKQAGYKAFSNDTLQALRSRCGVYGPSSTLDADVTPHSPDHEDTDSNVRIMHIEEDQKTEAMRVAERTLWQTRARKQRAIDVQDYLGATLLKNTEHQILQKLYTSQDSAHDRFRTLELELEKVRAYKKATVEAEDYLQAHQVKLRENMLVAKISETETPEGSTAHQRQLLREELKKVQAALRAAVEAEDFDYAHEVKLREVELGLRIKTFNRTVHNHDGSEDEGTPAPEIAGQEVDERVAVPGKATNGVRQAEQPNGNSVSPVLLQAGGAWDLDGDGSPQFEMATKHTNPPAVEAGDSVAQVRGKAHMKLTSELLAHGVVIAELESHERGAPLLELLQRLEFMTASKLHAEYSQRGFVADEFLSRSELAPLVKDVCILQEMKLSALQRECRSKGFEIEEDWPHSQLLQLLANSTWEEVGIPVTRFPDLEVARRVLDDVRNLDTFNTNALIAQCRHLSLPIELEPDLMVMHLKRVSIWRELPIEELRRDCKAFGVLRDVDPSSVDAFTREELIQQLVGVLRVDVYEAWGIPVQRLSSPESAERLLKWLDKLQNKGPSSLRAEYKKLNVVFDERLGHQELVYRLRDVMIWKDMPLQELLKECRKYKIADLSGREGMVSALLTQHQELWEWEANGVPVHRLQSVSASRELNNLYKNIEKMSMQDLVEWYRGINFPEEKSATMSDLRELLKNVVTWQELPLSELWDECARGGVPTNEVNQSGSDDEQRDQLMEALLMSNRMRWWDSIGFQAYRLGSPTKVIEAVVNYERFELMSDESLRQTYSMVAPLGPSTLAREVLLSRLKMRIIWEGLTPSALQQECKERGLPFQHSGNEMNDMKSCWVDMLFDDLRGIPVAQLSTMQDALDLACLFDSFALMGTKELEDAYEEEFAFAAAPAARKEDLIKSLRDFTLWKRLPLSRLWSECQAKQIPLDGFRRPGSGDATDGPEVEATGQDADEDSQDTHEELRSQLLWRLLLRARVDNAANETQKEFAAGAHAAQQPSPTETPGGAADAVHSRVPQDAGGMQTGPAADSTASRSRSPDARARAQTRPPACDHTEAPWDLPEVWQQVQHMRDPFTAHGICKVPAKQLPYDTLLPPPARSWPPIMAALYVLSRGTFDPQCDDCAQASRAMEGSNLFSVVCPTVEKRQHFHPLLYECFIRQTYEPKELVVVETGTKPSSFFQEVARDDARVVYRFFPVEDEAEDSSPESRSRSWSLGLKRNIACSLTRGAVIANFDDDDLYAPGYLNWMWKHIMKVEGAPLAPAAAKLEEWHIVDSNTLSFSHLDLASDSSVPKGERRNWLYGWGFSFVFTRAAWELAPFPDVHFAEDAGFMEGLLARSVPVSLVRLPEEAERALVAHTQHCRSTSGGEASNHQNFPKVAMPSAFARLMPTFESAIRPMQERGLSFAKKIAEKRKKLTLGAARPD